MARPTSRVSRVLMTGPLAPFADAYRMELRGRGYTVRSTVCELRQVARLSCWLAARGLTAAELSSARVDEFLVWQRAEGRYRSHWSRPGLRCLLDVLRCADLTSSRSPRTARVSERVRTSHQAPRPSRCRSWCDAAAAPA